MGGGAVVTIQDPKTWKDILSSAGDKAVIVDFTATWCGPCRLISPVFVELSTKYPSVIFLKVDVDDLHTIAAENGVSAMPTFQIFKDGKKVAELVGANPTKLEELIRSFA